MKKGDAYKAFREDSRDPGMYLMYPTAFPWPPVGFGTGKDQTPGCIVNSTKSFHPRFSRAFLGLWLHFPSLH